MPRRHHIRGLVIAPDESLRGLLRTLLSRLGVAVVTTATAADGQALLATTDFDILVLDADLGRPAVGELASQRRPATLLVGILAAPTPGAGPAPWERTITTVPKPFDLVHFERALAAVLGGAGG